MTTLRLKPPHIGTPNRRAPGYLPELRDEARTRRNVRYHLLTGLFGQPVINGRVMPRR